MTTLTDALVRSAVPSPGKAETVFWDERTTGFGLRIRSSGGRSWIWVRRGGSGKVERYTIGQAATMKAGAARAVAEARNAERDAARHGVTLDRIDRAAKKRAPKVGPTIRELAPVWLDAKVRAGRRAKTLHEYRRYVLVDAAELADKPAELITRSDLTTLFVELEEDRGSNVARGCRSAFSSMFEWLTTTGRLGDRSSPIHGSYKPHKNGSRERFLSPAELRAVWCASTKLRGAFGTIIRLLILTGQRRTEIGSLKRHEVILDIEYPQLELPGVRMKNHLAHLVPLSHQALALIEPWARSVEEGPLFSRGENGFSGWSKSVERFEPLVDQELGRPLEDWTLHDLRRSFITQSNDQGIERNGEVVELFVNHVSGKARSGVAGVYNRAHLIEPRRELSQGYADWITSIVS